MRRARSIAVELGLVLVLRLRIQVLDALRCFRGRLSCPLGCGHVALQGALGDRLRARSSEDGDGPDGDGADAQRRALHDVIDAEHGPDSFPGSASQALRARLVMPWHSSWNAERADHGPVPDGAIPNGKPSVVGDRRTLPSASVAARYKRAAGRPESGRRAATQPSSDGIRGGSRSNAGAPGSAVHHDFRVEALLARGP